MHLGLETHQKLPLKWLLKLRGPLYVCTWPAFWYSVPAAQRAVCVYNVTPVGASAACRMAIEVCR